MANHDFPVISQHHGVSSLEQGWHNVLFYPVSKEAFTYSSIKDVWKQWEQGVTSIDKVHLPIHLDTARASQFVTGQ